MPYLDRVTPIETRLHREGYRPGAGLRWAGEREGACTRAMNERACGKLPSMSPLFASYSWLCRATSSANEADSINLCLPSGAFLLLMELDAG